MDSGCKKMFSQSDDHILAFQGVVNPSKRCQFMQSDSNKMYGKIHLHNIHWAHRSYSLLYMNCIQIRVHKINKNAAFVILHKKNFRINKIL